MTIKGNILVGTVVQGVMMSADDGESWTRASVRQGMHSDSIVRMLRAGARRPEVVYAGTDMGLYRSDDRGGQWRLLAAACRGADGRGAVQDPPAVGHLDLLLRELLNEILQLLVSERAKVGERVHHGALL